jgi:predicted lipid carrier protein YhbT
VLLQVTVAALSLTAQQVAIASKPAAAAAAAGERLPSSQQLLESVTLAAKAFALLMKLVRSHDSDHLVFQASVRFGGKVVDLFLKVRAAAAVVGVNLL